MVATLDLLEPLVGFDTVSAKSNLDMVAFLQEFLAARGAHVVRVPDASGTKAGLFARIGPDAPGVMLSAHTDVVPVAGQNWSGDPFALRRVGDRVIGRGTTDMKGFLACALRIADRAGAAELKEPLKLALSYDEEVGCVGIASMIDHLEPAIGRPRACIVGEPTGMQVATGHKGKVGFRLEAFGEAGHSSEAPRFLNALHPAADMVAMLRRLQEDLVTAGAQDTAYEVACSTVHVGRLTGGTALNMIPDRAEMLFEIRHLPQDPLPDLVRRVEEAVAHVAKLHAGHTDRPVLHLTRISGYPGLEVADDSDLVVEMRRLSGQKAPLKVPYGTEAGHFAAAGIPAIVCGPGNMTEQGHKPDESIALQDLAACDAMLDRLLDTLRA